MLVPVQVKQQQKQQQSLTGCSQQSTRTHLLLLILSRAAELSLLCLLESATFCYPAGSVLHFEQVICKVLLQVLDQIFLL